MVGFTKIIAPSYNYLHNLDGELSVFNEKDAAFLSAEGGFLPLRPPALLEHPYDVWEKAASRVPEVCRSDKWNKFMDDIPLLPATEDYLADRFLPKANLCLGAIAHSIASVGFLEVPESVRKPWTEVARRLRRKHVSLLFYDTINNNFQLSKSSLTTATISDAWSQMQPCYTVTGTRAEHNFWKGAFCVEQSTQKLPSLVSAAQQAAVLSQVDSLRRYLVDIVECIHTMSDTFLLMDSRVYSSRFVGQVEFAISVDAAVRPIFEGQKTPAGSQSLTIHLLDAFFERGAYSSEFGKMLSREMHWIPELHQNFLTYVRKTSVLKFIQSLEASPVKTELNQLYFQALDAFAGEQGFLGIHARKLFGFVAVGTKVGRMQSSAGLSLLSWKNQNHHRIFYSMHAARHERLAQCESFHFDGFVSSNIPAHQPHLGNYVSVSSSSKICYEMGDVAAVLPENRNDVMLNFLSRFGDDGSHRVTIRSSKWIRALSDWNIDLTTTDEHVEERNATIALRDFLRIADLKQLNENLSSARSIEKIMVKGSDGLQSFYNELETLTMPLKERFYSIGSDPKSSPKKIDLFVGNVHFQTFRPLEEKKPNLSWENEVDSNAHSLQMSIPAHKPTKGREIRGIQTGISSSFLNNSPTGSDIRIRVVPEHRFRLPKDESVPVIMFALGRGVVPFIPYLKARSDQVVNNESDSKYKPWLILGVRSPSHILFRDEIEDAVHSRKTAKLSVACSRKDVTHCETDKRSALSFRSGQRMRLQQLFADSFDLQKQLWEMISVGAHIYCCGSPELGPVVNDIVSEAAFNFGTSFLRKSFSDESTGDRALSSRFPNILAAENRLHYSLFNSGPQKKVQSVRSMSQVACHRSADSTHVVFKGGVYDITNYLQIHPGGARLLLDFAGRDMTDAFTLVHGTDASAESMLEAYKIAEVESFPTANSTINNLREKWSENLLDQFLQHSSVLKLHLNDFPTLENRSDFDAFKTQWTTPRGKGLVLNRFLKSLEPDAFNSVISAIDGTSILSLLGDDDGFANVLEKCGWNSLPETFESIRRSWLGDERHQNSSVGDGQIDGLLTQARLLLESYVDMFVTVQEMVEQCCRQGNYGSERTAIESLLEESVRVMTFHLRTAYERYPLVSHEI